MYDCGTYIWIVECAVDCWCYAVPRRCSCSSLCRSCWPQPRVPLSLAACFFFCPCYFAGLLLAIVDAPPMPFLQTAAVAACPGYRDLPQMLNGLNWKFVGHRWTCWFVLWCASNNKIIIINNRNKSRIYVAQCIKIVWLLWTGPNVYFYISTE